MLSLMLAAVLGAGSGLGFARPNPIPQVCTAVEPECEHVDCDAECWEVRVQYHRDGAPAQATVGGQWGNISGVTCLADHLARHGFWLEGELQPTMVPAAALDLLVIDRVVP